MDLRTDDGGAAPARTSRVLVWAVVAVILIAGVVAALAFGPRITPLLDTLF